MASQAHRLGGVTLVALVFAACSSPPPPSSPEPAPALPIPAPARVDDRGSALEAASAGVSSPALATLLREHWDFELREDPVHATQLGVHYYDDRIGEVDEAAVARRRQARRDFRDRAKAMAELSEADALTRDLFVQELEGAIAAEVCEFHQWTISPRGNPVTEWNYLPDLHEVTTVASGRDLVARYRAIPKAIDDHVAALRRGASRGWYGNQESIARVLAMVDEQLKMADAQWPLAKPAKALPESWTDEEREEVGRGLRDAVSEEIRQALERYRALLKDELLAKARSPEETGLGALSMGEACYAARIKSFTTLDLDAAAIHEIGLEEIAKTDAELTALGNKALGSKDLADTLERLRNDPKLHFDSAEAVERAANETLALAKEKMGAFFGRLPKADCIVRRVPDYEAPYTTIAYYRQPHADGSKPGEYFVNVFKPATRPRYQAKVLAVHEAIPGHHLQIAIAQELDAVPAFRKYGGFTAFVEGWGLYTERLADEMGLYTDDLDRIGVASFDAWRAGRLVVDTGLHAMGWSRERAKAFLREHTALAETNVDNEIDRYINWPGQALAYKLGQRKIWSLRRAAERKLGKSFDRRAFHDVVLGAGAVTLPVLERRVNAWVDGRCRASGCP